MKKTGIFLVALSVSLTCSGLTAQNSTGELPPSLGRTAMNSDTDVPDYHHLPPGIDLYKNAIKNPDGSMTIRAGQQTPDANDINQRYCASQNGVDITNQSDQIIGKGTIYTVVCKGPVDQPPATNAQTSTGTERNPFGNK